MRVTSETLVLATSAVLFAIGAAGALLHRHPVAMLMAIEIMLNAANLLIVLSARVRGAADAEAAALIVLVLAAAEAVIGLALALALFRKRPIPDVDEAREVHG
ncbi:MAG TPA: NADH-quinone oxidoreductase subunit NuoK [Chloroflexota bacterium]|jgi:NADH-quinone oxidoreductase subunit K|nr:NADH-quinone oxidoreductase subunit NuoK [Chloroflexota bacterium]